MAAFYCPWCAEPFDTKGALNAHWMATPDCNRNRKANNPLQSKYGNAAGIENIPGEGMLTRVRSVGCTHPMNLREEIRLSMDPNSRVLGYRCGHCYTEVYPDN